MTVKKGGLYRINKDGEQELVQRTQPGGIGKGYQGPKRATPSTQVEQSPASESASAKKRPAAKGGKRS